MLLVPHGGSVRDVVSVPLKELASSGDKVLGRFPRKDCGLKWFATIEASPEDAVERRTTATNMAISDLVREGMCPANAVDLFSQLDDRLNVM